MKYAIILCVIAASFAAVQGDQCINVGTLSNGEVGCTDGNSVGTSCSFTCNTLGGYSLTSGNATSSVCLEDRNWDMEKPCCARTCPPIALLDMVILIDSSSSVGSENWNIMKNFVRTIINSFQRSATSTQISVLRYNRVVDTSTQILLNEYLTDQSGFLAAYDRIPYNGGGTLTGNALRYVNDVILTGANGDRPGVRDVLITLTDGRAHDNVLAPSRMLRAKGVETYVVGIQSRLGALRESQLLEISGSRDRMFILTAGFASLSRSFANMLMMQACGNFTTEYYRQVDCPITCEPRVLQPANGAVSCTDRNSAGSVCVYTCDSGYQVQGEPRISCNEVSGSGEWSAEPPTCEVSTCEPPLSTPRNGQMNCTDGNAVGSTCTFTCDDEYLLTGSPISRCVSQPNGDPAFTHPEPVCERIQCSDPPPAPVNGQMECSHGNNIGSQCTYTCSSDYAVVGDSVTTCRDMGNGEYRFDNPAPVCQMITCQPPYISIQSGEVSCTRSNEITSRCSFTCNQGYELVGEAILTCEDDSDGDPNGQWSSDAPFCRIIQCDDPQPPPANGAINCTDGTNIGSKCTYTCSSDYAVVGPPVTTCRNMGDGYRFDNPAPVCELKTCQPTYETLENGEVDCTNANIIHSQCTFSCGPDYDLIGEAVLTCNDDSDGDPNGQWSSDGPSCRRKQCGPPPPSPDNGQMQCSDGINLGSQCTYTCNPDYAVVGDSVSTCTDMGNGTYRFDNPAPVCQIKTCQPPYDIVTPSNGNVTCTNSNVIHSQCTFTCRRGFELVGEAVLTCNDDSDGDPYGQWSSDAPTCTRAQCSPPQPPPANGAINCSRGNNIGSQCTYTCGPDFAVIGPSVTTCRDMGNGDYRFDNPAPVCQLITCQPPFNTLANGGVNCTESNIVNSECTFYCESGFELVGAEVLTCNDDSNGDANGQWSDTEPFCRRLQCTLPPDPMNGFKVCSGGQFLGARCEFGCNPGYSLVGAQSADCSETQDRSLSFDNPPPTCELKTCQPPYDSLQNGQVSCTNNNAINSRCSFTCSPEYELVGEAILTCEDDSDDDLNGQWSSDAPFCRRKQCGPPPPSPDNGQMQCSDGINLGSQCTYTCNPDYAVVGDSVSTCTDMGNGNYRFDNPAPVCQIKTCQPPYDIVTPSNENVTCTNSNVIHSQCTFTCHRGFELVGEAVLTCNDDSDSDPYGQWSSDAPTCTRRQCSPPPPPPANGAINCSRGNNIGSQCTYTCGPDFAVIGPSVTTCRDMGDGNYQFDNPAPVCQLITCQPPFNTLANGGVNCTESNIVNSECTFYCESGFELVGAEVLTCNDDSNGDANGQWSDTEPFCRNTEIIFQDEPCFALGGVPNGEFTCSDGSNANSVCTLECDRPDGYFVYPPGNRQLTCLPNGTWDIPTPCCGRQCLMHSVFDIIFIMDSSTSIGLQNWVLMKSFVTDMISAFDVSADGTRVAVFRYNRGVDRRSQILFNRFINDKSGLITAVENIPYNGSGTWIGRALQYAQDHVLRYRNGNRLVRDVIITITDGRSYDSVMPVSDQLRSQGALTYALGITPGNGLGPSYSLLLEIAGSMDRVVFSTPALLGISDIFKQKLTNDLCGHPCASQCPRLLPPTNGLISCTNSNVEDSVCSFTCRPGFVLSGEPQTRCVDGPNSSNDGVWTSPAPMCLAQCRNYGVIDLVVVLDSSRSIGLKSWTDMKAFVRSLIGSFVIGPNAMRVSAFRYNRRVDTDTQILLNSYSDNSFFAAYDAIPYNGAGTRTALALQHVRDVILTRANGEWPAARNVVLTVTDGRSVSSIVPISEQLRANGVLTYALGVPPIIGNGMNTVNLLALAGSPSRRFLANNGNYGGLYEQFVNSLVQETCSPPLLPIE
nr:sushi, von Willebrand factor type A, EGF and pentraxin domain-containing protein 1 isoform X1 [Ciona intestinalis]|eukprot:XP_018670279.1 sushi, von Willebrand factor type A, EGF and pentraxin domain-containing protein 1 isoform X1 [Ciona intestinalis]